MVRSSQKNQIRYTTQYSWNHRCGRRRLHNCLGFMEMCIRDRGRAVLHCRMEGALDTDAVVTIRCREA